ncbi:MAG: cobyrinate a,c-diamide synthase [Pseudomonadota bacterium]
MQLRYPRIVISALRGGVGKTVVSLGIIKGWQNKGLTIASFKKGPDFIDASWLKEGSGRPCYNLDTFLIDKQSVFNSFIQRAQGADGSVVEGNRGLYDGMDQQGSHSTAVLAKLLKIPIVLVVDCAKTTRTAAALVLGCQKMDRGLNINGVVLNQIAGKRHASIIRSSIEQKCKIPVLGEIPRLKEFPFKERHMGLTPPQEIQRTEDYFNFCEALGKNYLDLERLWQVALGAPDLTPPERMGKSKKKGLLPSVRIGVIRDSAFQFYYPENLEALENHGGQIVEISALKDKELPPVDALYIGGGFPETHLEMLADNASFRRSLYQAIEDGLPVYAECGGAMYLGESVLIKNKTFPMVGVFPVVFTLDEKPCGHGYTILKSDVVSPYYKKGTTLKGHEFHYSRIEAWKSDQVCFTFTVKRGFGFDGRRDGLCYKNVLSTYTHIHALGEKRWANAMVRQAELFKEKGLIPNVSK